MTESGEAGRAHTATTGVLPSAPPVQLRDLPGAAEGGPLWWRRKRGMALDVSLAVVSAAECAVEGAGRAKVLGFPMTLGVLVGLVGGGTLVLRRRWPAAVVLVALGLSPLQVGILLSTVGLYTLAASDASRRLIATLGAANLVAGGLVSFFELEGLSGQGNFTPPTATVVLLSLSASVATVGPPLFLGLYIGARRRLVESLRERADGLERELTLLADHAEERAEWARREERTRIAREMHDVVAHRVSLMVVHAAALQAVAAKDPQKASRNAALIGDMGRQALTELRTMLGALRADDDRPAAGRCGDDRAGAPGDAPADAARAGASRAAAGAATDRRGPPDSPPDDDRGGECPGEPPDGQPTTGGNPTGEGTLDRIARYAAASARRNAAGARPARGPERTETAGPGLADLQTLVNQSKAAGMPVELSVEGEPRRYTARVERTAYRVVQEALTNVHKHAAGAATRVRLARRETEVAVQVENEPPVEGVSGAQLPSGGNGLVGMRERVTALGGGFVYGPTERGGFRVSAVVPDQA